MEVGSVIARLKADLKSFDDAFAHASRVLASPHHNILIVSQFPVKS